MKRIVISILLILIAAPAFACTTVIVSAKASASGRPLMWKQRDTGAEFNYLAFFPADEGRYSYTGVVNTADTEKESVWCGSNEVGFSVMNAMSYGLSPLVTDDRPYEGIVMKRALEICRTVSDFEEYIKSLPRPNGLESNFGVIDAEGGAAYFEVHDYGFTRFDVADAPGGYLIRSNWSVTGRKGEGKGYDRYDVAAAKMKAHTGGFTAEWIIDKLGRDPLIARSKTVNSVVFEGVGAGDPVNSTLIWAVMGYTPYAFVLPAWVAAEGLFPAPLGENGRSAQNELSNSALRRYGDIEPRIALTARQRRLIDAVRAEESLVAGWIRSADRLFRAGEGSPEALEELNGKLEAEFGRFEREYGVSD